MAALHLPRAMAAAFGGRGVGGARGRCGRGGGGRRPRRGRSGGAAASLLLTVALIVPEVDAAHLGGCAWRGVRTSEVALNVEAEASQEKPPPPSMGRKKSHRMIHVVPSALSLYLHA